VGTDAVSDLMKQQLMGVLLFPFPIYKLNNVYNRIYHNYTYASPHAFMAWFLSTDTISRYQKWSRTAPKLSSLVTKLESRATK
jgi:hypothetical protein